MGTITRDHVLVVRSMTGEGIMACHKALKETDGDVHKAIDYLRNSGNLVAIKRKVVTVENIRESFEKHWSERFSFEIKRGVGRFGHDLKRDDAGNYISEKAQFAWEIWQEAKK